MALITFSSPNYKDKTVYAVAGSHTETILKIAKEYKVPINFECENGECGNWRHGKGRRHQYQAVDGGQVRIIDRQRHVVSRQGSPIGIPDNHYWSVVSELLS